MKFITQFGELGYKVEYRVFNAADYGTPTMRKRFFLVARCGGKAVRFPEPTHAPAGSAEVAAKTMERIARGLKKYVIDNTESFVV